MSELLPCPFCGSSDVNLRSSLELVEDASLHTEHWWSECLNCEAAPFPPSLVEAEAIAAWNTRAKPHGETHE